MAQPRDQDQDQQPAPRRRFRPVQRVGLWLLFSVTAMCLALAVVLFALIGRPVTVPTWLADRSEALLADQLPHLDVSMGHLSIVVENGLRPRIRAHALRLNELESSGAVELEQVDIALSPSALFNGRIAPSRIRVSGVSLSLRRLIDGSFNVSLGQRGQSAEAIDARATLQNLGSEIGSLLEAPFLAELEEIKVEALHLRYEDARARKGWTIDGGQARLSREGDDVSISAILVALGNRSYSSTVEMSVETSITSNISHFGMSFQDMPAPDIASQSPALAWLGILEAPISGSLRASTDGNGNLGPTAVALQIGKGALQPNDQVRPIPFESVRTYLSYDPVEQTLTLDDFTVQADLVTASAHGKAILQNVDQGFPSGMIVQLEFSQLEVNPNTQTTSPISLESVFADFRLRLQPFDLSVGQLVLSQQGQRLKLSGHLRPDDDVWDYALDGSMPHVEKDTLLAVWPGDLKPNLRKWITDNIRAVNAHDVNLALRSRAHERPDFYADFQFHDLTLKFMKTMPVLQGGKGTASFLRNQFLVGAEAGYVVADDGGKVDVTGTGFVVENTRIKESPARVSLKAKGAITSVLSLLNREPLSVMDKAGLPVDLADGDVHGTGVLNLTLKKKIKPEDVRFDVRLAAPDVTTGHFIKDKLIAGHLTGHATNEQITLEGEGTVGVVPVQARWISKLGPAHDGTSTLTGAAEISERAMQEFEVGFPENTFSGRSEGNFRMDIVRGTPPKFTLSSDVVGLGASFAPLGWRKSPETEGELQLDMTIASPASVDAFTFSAPGLDVAGSVSLKEEGGLDRVALKSFRVGNWLRGTGEIRGRGNLPVAIHLSSGRFDIRGLPPNAGGGASAGQSRLGPLSANLQTVQISESFYLKDFNGAFEDRGGLGGKFTGSFNGMAPIYGELVTTGNRQAFKITSERGGDVITALGIAQGSTGTGNMLLHLKEGDQAGVYDGVAAIQNVKIQDAPAFAELLNAVSIVGLLEQLSGPGILLTEIESKFRLSPNKLLVTQASAVGPGMGISLDGVMNLSNNVMDFQGAITPIYILNSVGRVISKKGEGLVAFNYRLQGTPDKLRVTVNPLSALTPGFFRGIFRAPSEVDSHIETRRPREIDENELGPDNR